jgi:type IV secretory pathway VirB2 component (pilin)
MTPSLLTAPQQSLEQKYEGERQFHRFLLAAFAILLTWIAIPEQAHAATNFNFPIIDDLFCGFITYSKTKLAPYIAVLVIIIGVIGHWLGATKVWGTILYVVIGLGIIGVIGSIVSSATNAGASCLSS